MNVDITSALFTLGIQYDYTKTHYKEGASDINVHWRVPIRWAKIKTNQGKIRIFENNLSVDSSKTEPLQLRQNSIIFSAKKIRDFSLENFV